MRKKQFKTLFAILVILLIGSLVISACNVDPDAAAGGAGGQGKGKGQNSDNNNDADDDDDSPGNSGGNKDKDKDKDKDKSDDDDDADDDDDSPGNSGGNGNGNGNSGGDDTGGDDTGGDDTGGDDDDSPGNSGGNGNDKNATPTEEIDDGPENDKGNGKNKKITICHATGSESNPYVEITVADDGVYNGHNDHDGDIIPAPAGGCPGSEKTKTPNPPQEKITICHATGSEKNPYVEITVADDGVYNGHSGHDGDIIPAPAGGCPGPEETPTPPPNDKITICHATGSEKNPYVVITVADDGVYNGHSGHDGDIIPAPAGGCPGPEETPTPTVTVTPSPTPTDTPEPGNTYVCHYTGDAAAPYEALQVQDDGTLGGHDSHSEDIYPVPANGCPGPEPTPEPHPEIEPEALGMCVDFLVFHTLRDGDLEVYRLDGSENDSDFSLINLSQGSSSEDFRAARSWDDSMIVFESNRNGNVELFLNSTSGGALRQLTNTSSNSSNPVFLRDNQTVVFESDRNGSWDIFTINLNSGEERQLTTDPNTDIFPFASPDNEWVAFQTNRAGNWDIYLLNVTTGEEFAFATSNANETYPTWSPDGKYIAYLSDYAGEVDLYIQNVETGEKTALTWGADSTANNPSWSPDGTRIAYQSTRNGNLDIYTYDMVDDIEYRATNYTGFDSAPTWDCAGENVSFTSDRDNDVNVLEVYWQGGENFFLTNDPAVDKWSQWSPSKEQGSRDQ